MDHLVYPLVACHDDSADKAGAYAGTESVFSHSAVFLRTTLVHAAVIRFRIVTADRLVDMLCRLSDFVVDQIARVMRGELILEKVNEECSRR